ncbi:putative alpha/beta superfamily hydrolase [Neolewinella xylanilytica]|uniref:Putative alpha/beta superfamily hydrolase n=1 Tax=Neolewinella xylanilytica TaxID=1514080 RepID=A0A2S6I1Y6_9BACT|nr:alpha/beta hydrolase-fold protein [Neolewinella xylanilytica]PPK85163.1 putative alpha/beta superfamily hydrolase [Neolewinella xylanilytica]
MPERTLRLITTTDDPRPVYVAGTFNNWNARDENYRMLPGNEPGAYTYTFVFGEEVAYLEYKYTRGGWEAVELGADGASTENHSRYVSVPWVLPDHVERWASPGLRFNPHYLPKIEVIHEAFEIPELIRTRRVAALLPHDYATSGKHYPVLYLQDGQNLFDDYAPYGSWGVDKRLANLAESGMGDLIVIAIDHAESERVSEFTPSFQTRLGRGDGRMYVRFLAETLKPYVDRHFRTRPEPQHTGIGGSSLGGLISIYAGIMYPAVYQKLMIFSPSLWVTPEIPFRLMNLTHQYGGRIYLYGGAAESSTMVPNMERFQQQILKQPGATRLDVRLAVDPFGQHNEARWGSEFPLAIEWLFFTA